MIMLEGETWFTQLEKLPVINREETKEETLKIEKKDIPIESGLSKLVDNV